MKLLFLCVALLIAFSTEQTLNAANQAPKKGTYVYSIKSYEGRKNVLLIFAPSKKDARFEKQIEAVKNRFAEFRKIDTVVYYVFEKDKGRADTTFLRTVDAADLRKSFKVADDSFRMIYVDKQGKVKKDSKEPIDKEKIGKFLGFK